MLESLRIKVKGVDEAFFLLKGGYSGKWQVRHLIEPCREGLKEEVST